MNPLDPPKTQFQMVDELCGLGAFKKEPYEECTGKGIFPDVPAGATAVKCEKKRCWPIRDQGQFYILKVVSE